LAIDHPHRSGMVAKYRFWIKALIATAICNDSEMSHVTNMIKMIKMLNMKRP